MTKNERPDWLPSSGGLTRANDDVAGPQVLDLLLRLVADAFTECDEPDDGRDADQDPEHGQRGPQFVQQQAVESQPKCQQQVLQCARAKSQLVEPCSRTE